MDDRLQRINTLLVDAVATEAANIRAEIIAELRRLRTRDARIATVNDRSASSTRRVRNRRRGD